MTKSSVIPLQQLIEQKIKEWRAKAQDYMTDPDYGPGAKSDGATMLDCADDLATLLAHQEQEVAPVQEPRIVLTPTQEAYRDKLQSRAYERLNLCPDHRDKATGLCIVCQAEWRTRQEMKLAAAEAREGQPEKGWQPIATAPEFTKVLVWAPYGLLATSERQGNGWIRDDGNWFSGGAPYEPTHWRPLPDPPAGIVPGAPKE